LSQLDLQEFQPRTEFFGKCILLLARFFVIARPFASIKRLLTTLPTKALSGRTASLRRLISRNPSTFPLKQGEKASTSRALEAGNV
jgi:hypothetical protein